MMAKTEQTDALEAIPLPPARVGFATLLMAVTLATLAAVAGSAGAVYWLVRSGTLPLTGRPVTMPAAAALPMTQRTHLVALDPLLVNLADEGGHAYLRVSMTLSLLDTPPDKSERAKEAAEKSKTVVIPHDAEIRDAALSVIGRQTATQLLALDGKDTLKAALRGAIATRVPEMKVADLYFTEFLVQR